MLGYSELCDKYVPLEQYIFGMHENLQKNDSAHEFL
jgi:hypothetical protein